MIFPETASGGHEFFSSRSRDFGSVVREIDLRLGARGDSAQAQARYCGRRAAASRHWVSRREGGERGEL